MHSHKATYFTMSIIVGRFNFKPSLPMILFTIEGPFDFAMLYV